MTEKESALERRRRKNSEAADDRDLAQKARDAKRHEAQKAMMKKSIHKASTARAHKRPPPIVKRGTARASALEMLTSFLDTSVQILHEQLHAERVTKMTDEDGNPIYEPDHAARRRAAQLVIDKVAAAEGTYLPEGLDVVVDTENPLEMGRQVVELVLSSQLSVEAAQKIFTLLQAQAQLQGLNELDELRDLVAQLSGANAKTVNGVPGDDQNPVWMRLKQHAPTTKG